MIGEVTSSPATFDKLDIYQHHLTVPSTMAHHPWPPTNAQSQRTLIYTNYQLQA